MLGGLCSVSRYRLSYRRFDPLADFLNEATGCFTKRIGLVSEAFLTPVYDLIPTLNCCFVGGPISALPLRFCSDLST